MERLIYSSVPCTDFVEDVMNNNPGMQDSEALMLAYDQLQEDRKLIADEFQSVKGNFVIYGSAGLWNGRQSGFTPYIDTSLGDVLMALTADLENTDSMVSVYVDDNGDITARKAHHDGVNLYTLRELDRDYDEDEFEDLSSDYFEENAKPCGHYIADKWGA